MTQTKWNKQQVIETIRVWHYQGLPLQGLYRADRTLYRAACHRFGNWNEAVRAAGFAPKPYIRWSKERIIAEIQAWYRPHAPQASVWHDHPWLVAAGQRHFGTWRKALSAAEIEPQRKWSPERVIEAIQSRHVKGLSVKIGRRQSPRLLAAANRHFGSWANAVAAAGIRREEDQPRRLRRWTRQRAIEELQAWHAAWGMVPHTQDNPSLACALERYFGSWRQALAALGLEPRPRRWNRQRIIDEIRALHQRGMSAPSIWRERGDLTSAAVRHFGSRHAALVAAGFASQYAKPKPHEKWSQQRIIDVIRAHQRQGLLLSSAWRRQRRMVRAACWHFGSWSKALRAAGIVLQQNPRGQE